MRRLVALSVLALSAATTLSACASTGPTSYDEDMAKLEADCRARGGILTPTGAMTGRPQTEYACEIRGQSSGRLNN